MENTSGVRTITSVGAIVLCYEVGCRAKCTTNNNFNYRPKSRPLSSEIVHNIFDVRFLNSRRRLRESQTHADFTAVNCCDFTGVCTDSTYTYTEKGYFYYS